MPTSDESAINLRRLAMQLTAQLPQDGSTAREVMVYMTELVEWEGRREGNARLIRIAASK